MLHKHPPIILILYNYIYAYARYSATVLQLVFLLNLDNQILAGAPESDRIVDAQDELLVGIGG